MGAELPRVTDILRDTGLGPDLSRIPADVLESARDRGQLVHAAIEALVYGYLDEAEVAPIAAPYLDAYRKFVVESGYEAKYAEVEVVHSSWGYRGHPDGVGFLMGRRILIDFKSGGAEGVEYQLAAYRAAFNAQHPTEPVEAVAALMLRRDSSYRFIEHAWADAEPVWLAAVTVFKARQRRAA
jgi:hypothetical protein